MNKNVLLTLLFLKVTYEINSNGSNLKLPTLFPETQKGFIDFNIEKCILKLKKKNTPPK